MDRRPPRRQVQQKQRTEEEIAIDILRRGDLWFHRWEPRENMIDTWTKTKRFLWISDLWWVHIFIEYIYIYMYIYIYLVAIFLLLKQLGWNNSTPSKCEHANKNTHASWKSLHAQFWCPIILFAILPVPLFRVSLISSTDNGLFIRGWLYSWENLWFWDTYTFDLIIFGIASCFFFKVYI